jgi:uncharacterized protein (TIRG00374 family)
LLAAAVLAAGVWLLARRWQASGFNPDVFLATLSGAHLGWLGLSMLLTLLSYYGRVLRWAVMLEPLRPRPHHGRLLEATVIGYAAIVLLGRAGELVRPYLISRKERVPFSSQLAVLLLERIYDLLLVLAVFGYSLIATGAGDRLGPGMNRLLDIGGTMVGALGSLCLLVLAGLHLFTERIEQRLRTALGFLEAHHLERVESTFKAVLDGLRSTKSAGAVARILLYSLVEWIIIGLCFFSFFRAFPQTGHWPLAESLVILGFVAFGSIVQIPGVGGGVQIVCILVLTEMYGLPLGAATGIALVMWVVTFVTVLPFGIACAVREGFGWRSLRMIKDEATL